MTSYDIAVTIHIVCVILWVGGGITLLLGAELARRRRGASGVLPIVDTVALLGPTFFVPLSLLTLLSGVAAAWVGPGFSHLWVLLGLIGFAATFLTGFVVIKPRAEEISVLMADADTQPAVLLQKSVDLMTIARFDYVVLVLVVLVMALKPTASDVAALTGLAVFAVLGAMMTLAKGMRPRPGGA
ncbi:MAG: DUF2269 family protein [Yoonia sp.]|uniref:DUF2269 family protein n=1 Tax=Yoonia sp. TaxID=2212373 RepID=UPI00273D891C|nr:DUF2269 family protein [Yoonia sp.]MDP5084372.1 DUF2269 family protein [Yoonia sp.]